MSALPVNDWSVQATLTVATNDEATATSTVTTALSDIRSSLATLANGTSLSVVEDPQGTYSFDYSDAVNGNFYLEGELNVGEVSQAEAQSAVEAAVSSINSAISAIVPAVTVELESTPDGYVFNLLQ